MIGWFIKLNVDIDFSPNVPICRCKLFNKTFFREFNEAVRVINKKMRDHTEQLEKEKNITYTPRLENLIK